MRIFCAAMMLLLQHGRMLGQDVEADTVRPSTTGFLPLPVIFYTPETGLAVGGVLMVFHRPHPEYRPSAGTAEFIYTEKKQMLMGLGGEAYLNADEYRFDGDLGYQLFPQKFFGIGNSTDESMEERYTSSSLRLSLNVQRRMTRLFKAGFGMYVERRRFSDLVPQGLIATAAVHGSGGGTLSGFGVLASIDTRDNVFSSSAGMYHQVSIKLFSAVFGSDYRYLRANLDLRHFLPVWGDAVLAWQIYGVFIDGDPPFSSMPLLGGQNLMRGYFEGRFRDKNFAAGQCEVRIPVWWQFDAAVFVAAGEVAGSLRDFSAEGVKPSWGFGLRYTFDPKENLKLRADFGFGRSASGFYVAASEAF